MPIQRIAGCAAAFGMLARRKSPIRRHAEELPKAEWSGELLVLQRFDLEKGKGEREFFKSMSGALRASWMAVRAKGKG
jgi:hypothetical protein